MLFSLAPELIQAISHELRSIEDVKSLRLTCQQTGQALATEVLHRITLNINTETFEKELFKLQYLASARGSQSGLAIQGIRQINIKSLSPALNPKEPWSGGDSEGHSAATEKWECHERELKKFLYNALSFLTTVRIVRWVPAAKDSEWAHTTVMNALKTYSNLQSLSVELQNCRIEIPFHHFTALRHISVYCVGEDALRPVYHTKSFENLIKMISQSPLLEWIDFTNSYNYKRRQISTRSLHQLFERYPEDGNGNIPPLRLKRLSLASCLVRLDDEIVMRHLKYLTSLTLEDLLEPLTPLRYGDDSDDLIRYSDDDDDNPIFKDVLATQNRWGSSYEDIWRTICNAGLRLEEITLYVVPPAFVDYIGSYSGLKKLVIGTGGFKDEVTSDKAGRKFYKVLEKHAGSIEELDIDAYYQGSWCFGHHNKALLSTLQNLKTLSMKVKPSDLVPKSELGHQDIITVLIDTVVIHISQLQALTASIAVLDFGDRHNICGMDKYFRYSRYNQKIVVRVLQYRAPRGCKRLPIFTVKSPTIGSDIVFVSQPPDSMEERLRYENVSSPANLEYPDSVDTDDEE